jgi:glycosyltransferase involved in cell wall biosynthesis
VKYTLQQNHPLITVGITCYNAENTIGRAIESALSQDWSNFEIVIVNDCSKDNSQAIINKKAEKDNRIRFFIHDHNKGCAVARNLICHEAKGVFIAFFDDDDISSYDRLSVQYTRILDYEKESGQTLIACYTSGTRYYPNGYEMPIRAIGSQGGIPQGLLLADYLLVFQKKKGIFYGGGTPACSLMIRKTVFQKVGGFDKTLRRQEDADFAIRLAMMGGHFIGTKEILLHQYASTGSDKNALTEYESSLTLLRKNRSYLETKSLYKYMLVWSELRYRHFNHEHLKGLYTLIKLIIRYPVRTTRHFMSSALKRKVHEINMNKD